MAPSFDIIVLGSGIAGSALALVLQRAGLRTLCVERKTHPRFVIGESTVPTTSFLLKQLAADYDVPELGQIAHYLGLREQGCAAWPKQGFWHGCHRPGAPLDPHHEHYFETLLLPIGPDVHMLRADVDAFLASRLPHYGVAYEENTEVTSFDSTPQGVTLGLDGPRGRRDVSARLVVDATGHASFLARRFNLRDETPRLATNTRSIFAHFADVPPLDETLGGCNPAFRFRRDSCTQHHCFRGGWIWVIPFDNGITSVGVQLDRNQHPLDERVSPEAEIALLCERYPSIAAHLARMRPVRPLLRTDRIQFTSSSILGNGFILAPHAAAFVEPLYSTGILLTMLFISRFVPAAQAALATGDWGQEQFRWIEQCFFRELEQIDHMVDGSVQSFRDNELYKQYWRIWVLATMSHFGDCLLVGRAPKRPTFWGASIPDFSAHLARAHEAVIASRSIEEDRAVAERIHRETAPFWEQLGEPLLVANDLGLDAKEGSLVYGSRAIQRNLNWTDKICRQPLTARPEMSPANARKFFVRAALTQTEQIERYRRSRADGSDYHLALEKVLEQHNPTHFDYYREIGLDRP